MAYSNIDKPSSYFNTKLYTGNSNATQTISGVGFQPDFSWLKCRDSVEFHHLADAVRGANKFLHSNNTDAERTGSYDGGSNTMAFTSDGFSLTNPTATDDELNFGSRLYCSWNWKANGAGSSNTAGSITSTVSANTTSGFSIVSYTANASTTATIGHGLGVAPSMIIVKERSGTSDWMVYHKSLGAGNSIKLNSTSASASNTISFGNTSPTSTLFTVGEDGGDYQTNYPNGATYIAYCFAEVKGFSKFGSYTGNNSLNNFVYTGFKPAFVMIKVTSTTEQWCMKDNKRNTINPLDRNMFANASNSEDYNTTNHLIDFVSNGFNLKDNTSQNLTNGSGQTYVYMAFAESPFVSSKGIPTTAR